MIRGSGASSCERGTDRTVFCFTSWVPITSDVQRSRDLHVSMRAAQFCREAPERFLAAVRDSVQRGRSGLNPLDALEQALDAAHARELDATS
jgi:hypothetical protein